jgi:hypothetical protein
MKRFLILAVLTSVVVMGLPAAAQKIAFSQDDCYQATATVPVTREQAQSHLPSGWKSSMGSASQSEVPYVYITSIVCGEEGDPNLTISAAYLLTHPPKRYKNGEDPARFILAAAAGGVDAGKFERKLCLDDLLVPGDISQTVHVGSPTTTDGAFGSTVASEAFAADWDVVTTQLIRDGMSATRWFFEGDQGIEDFYSIEMADAIGIGTGEVRFTEPFLDLPQAASGPALFDYSQMSFPARCPR